MHHLLCFTWPVGLNSLLDHSRDDIPELVGCMRHTPAISLITHFLFPIILMDDILYSEKREKEMLQSQEEWDDGSCSEWMNMTRQVLTFLHPDHTTGRTSGGMEEAFPPGRCRPSPGENKSNFTNFTSFIVTLIEQEHFFYLSSFMDKYFLQCKCF